MRHKISVTINKENLEKIDEGIKKGKFRNRSHAFDYSLSKLLDEEGVNANENRES